MSITSNPWGDLTPDKLLKMIKSHKFQTQPPILILSPEQHYRIYGPAPTPLLDSATNAGIWKVFT